MTRRRSDALADAVEPSYLDAADVEHRISDEALTRLRNLVGTPPEDAVGPVIVSPRRSLPFGGEVRLEQGGSLSVPAGEVPAELPWGYHVMVTASGQEHELIVSPGRCVDPGTRRWGWASQLYASRSRASWGIGDLADLGRISHWAADSGAGFVLVNPLAAVALGAPQEPSPYFPSSRRYGNPLYLAVEQVPGAAAVDLTAAVAAGRRLNDDRRIDRDEVWRLKRAALESILRAAPPGPDFERWRADQGESLAGFATWSAIADTHGNDWHRWPEPLQHPSAPEVGRYARDHAEAVTFHAWLQWLFTQQRDHCARVTTLISDLPVGIDPNGADAWAWSELLATGVSVGAPPDLFNRSGQDWGLAPYVPWRLRAAGYRPFIESVRASMASGGGLRIDHVMGLFRLWWVPEDQPAAEGGYVRYPAQDLIDIIALESVRAGALVVGEDLGTVAAGVRETMAEANLMSYRLLWFEEDPPARWPAAAMAAVSTHDLPTVAGVWTGADLTDQQRWQPEVDESGAQGLHRILTERTGLAAQDSPEQAVRAAYRALGEAPSRLLTATLEDALALPDRPNLPGAADRPNWSMALPRPLEDLEGGAVGSLPADIAAILSQAVGDEGVRDERTGGESVRNA